MPDELRKHYLSDGEGGQYSTNLDRNRYGNDDQYLFTGASQHQSAWRACMVHLTHSSETAIIPAAAAAVVNVRVGGKWVVYICCKGYGAWACLDVSVFVCLFCAALQ